MRRVEIEAVHDDASGLLDEFSRPQCLSNYGLPRGKARCARRMRAASRRMAAAALTATSNGNRPASGG